MTSKGQWQLFSWMSLIRTLTLCVGLFGLSQGAGAKDFVFEAQELGKGKGPFEMGEAEIWLPTAVVIDQKGDLNEPVWFVVRNPTGIDHEFAVAGLFMLLPEEEVIPETKLDPGSGGLLPRKIPVPIHLKVKAGETKRIQVSPSELAGQKNLGARYQFFCPKHKDIRVSGFVYVD